MKKKQKAHSSTQVTPASIIAHHTAAHERTRNEAIKKLNADHYVELVTHYAAGYIEAWLTSLASSHEVPLDVLTKRVVLLLESSEEG